MGFITTINAAGREVYACEFSFTGCVTTGCRALHCPFDYCQRYYACPSCLPQVKGQFAKDNLDYHKACREYHKDEQANTKTRTVTGTVGDIVDILASLKHTERTVNGYIDRTMSQVTLMYPQKVTLNKTRSRTVTGEKHTVSLFVSNSNRVCYSFRKNPRTGFPLPYTDDVRASVTISEYQRTIA